MNEIRFIKLPPEILVNIFVYLNFTDLRNLMLCSKYLREFIINDPSIWKFICKDRLIIKGNVKGYPLSGYSICRISHNWCKGIFKSKVIIQNKINFIPWMQLVSSKILLISFGSELRCYSIDNFGQNRGLLWTLNVPTTKRFDIRTNDISRFIVKDHLIVCGNRDGSTAVYEFHDLNKRPILLHYKQNCHNNGQIEVSAVEKWKGGIVTASNASCFLHLWCVKNDIFDETQYNFEANCFDNGMLKQFPIAECNGCRSLAVDTSGTKLAIGLNGNNKPVCIDLNIGEYSRTPQQGTKTLKHVIRDIQWHNETGLMYVTHSGKLEYMDLRTAGVNYIKSLIFIPHKRYLKWSRANHIMYIICILGMLVTTYEVYETRDPFLSPLFCVRNDGDKAIVTGSAEYSRCVLFDLRSPYHVQMYFTQKKASPIYSLDFDAKKLIAAADQKVALVNFNVNSNTAIAKNYSHVFKLINCT